MTLMARHGSHEASELTRLRAENERLRAALKEALRIMERVPQSATDHRPIEDVCKQMRDALDHGLPSAEDVRGILKPET